MRVAAAGFGACLGIVALASTTGAFAAGAGTQSAVISHRGAASTQQPKIVLLKHQTGLAGSCGGSAFDVNTFINVDTTASADVKVTAPGVGLIEEFTDETGANIGPYNAVYPNFHILAFGGGLPPDTPITITITTYSGANLTGSITEVSSLTFACTSGAVLAAPGGGTGEPIPSLSSPALAATAALLLLFGAIALRRRVR